jgi:hypothetical protein
VQLGAVNSLPTDAFDGSRWLSVEVDSSGTELSPRIAITAVPWALNATSAQGLQGVAVSSTAPTTVGQVLSWDGAAWAPAQVLQNGLLGLAQGGTGADLSSTGPGWLRQPSMGAAVTVETPNLSDLGDVSIVSTPADGQTLVWNSTTNRWEPGSTVAPSVPSGAVMFFNLTVCPSGWTELITAQGRYLVGLNPGGTLAGTDGAALSDLEDRPVGQHTHTVTDPGHTHTIGQATSNSGTNGSYVRSGTTYLQTQSTSSSSTGITIDQEGSVAGTNAPYIQLLVCQKN